MPPEQNPEEPQGLVDLFLFSHDHSHMLTIVHTQNTSFTYFFFIHSWLYQEGKFGTSYPNMVRGFFLRVYVYMYIHTY